MSLKHMVSRMTPSLSHRLHSALTGRTPTPSLMQRVAGGYNHVSCRQKKVVLFRMQNFRAVTGGSSAAINIWPGYFRTGENTTGLTVYAGVVVTPFASASPPNLTTIVKTTAGVTVASSSITFAGASASHKTKVQ